MGIKCVPALWQLPKEPQQHQVLYHLAVTEKPRDGAGYWQRPLSDRNVRCGMTLACLRERDGVVIPGMLRIWLRNHLNRHKESWDD